MDEEWNDDLAEMAGEFGDADFDPMEARRGRGRRGGARVIELFGKQAFDYSFLAVSATQTDVMRRALRIVPQYHLWLLMRVHNLDMPVGPNAGNIVLRCWNTLPSKQDPREFTIGGTSPLFVTAINTTTPGTLLAANATNQGPFFKVELLFTQGTVAGRLYAELSAVLYGRPS